MQDGYQQLAPGGADMRGRVRIQFVDQHGTHEAGVDGGGLFKDFMEGLVKEGFSPATCAPRLSGFRDHRSLCVHTSARVWGCWQRQMWGERGCAEEA